MSIIQKLALKLLSNESMLTIARTTNLSTKETVERAIHAIFTDYQPALSKYAVSTVSHAVHTSDVPGQTNTMAADKKARGLLTHTLGEVSKTDLAGLIALGRLYNTNYL